MAPIETTIEYLNDAEKLFENLQNLDDFRKFSKYISEWIAKKD
jgi:hypothetical protein